MFVQQHPSAALTGSEPLTPGQVTFREICTTRDESPLERTYHDHEHEQHELMWFQHGSGIVTTTRGTWTIEENSAVWIPARSRHALVAGAGSCFYPLLIAPALGFLEDRWQAPHVLALDRMATELVLRLGMTVIADTHRADLTRVIHTVLNESEASHALRVPTGRRISQVAAAVLSDPSKPHQLEDWARRLHVSARTLSRDWIAETGLTYKSWVVRARVQAALPPLRQGMSVEQVATKVGYRNTSSFIDAFRMQVGTTPGAYARRQLMRR